MFCFVFQHICVEGGWEELAAPRWDLLVRWWSEPDTGWGDAARQSSWNIPDPWEQQAGVLRLLCCVSRTLFWKRDLKNKLDFFFFFPDFYKKDGSSTDAYLCLSLQRERRGEALYDLQDASWIRLCRALWRALFVKRPCPALSPALVSATQWRPGCSAVASGTRQICSHAFSTHRGTQAFTDSEPHGGTAACHSGNVTQRNFKKDTKGHVYCILQEWLHQGAMCKVLHYSETIWVCEWDFTNRSGTGPWMSATTLLVLVSLSEKTVWAFSIFFFFFFLFFFVLHLLPFAKCTPVMHRSHLYLQNRRPGH